MLSSKPTVSVIYFQPDEKKDGGSYQTITGVAKRINSIGGTLLFTDSREISLSSIIDIQLEE